VFVCLLACLPARKWGDAFVLWSMPFCHMPSGRTPRSTRTRKKNNCVAAHTHPAPQHHARAARSTWAFGSPHTIHKRLEWHAHVAGNSSSQMAYLQVQLGAAQAKETEVRDGCTPKQSPALDRLGHQGGPPRAMLQSAATTAGLTSALRRGCSQARCPLGSSWRSTPCCSRSRWPAGTWDRPHRWRRAACERQSAPGAAGVPS
jgi:hypothetical protein